MYVVYVIKAMSSHHDTSYKQDASWVGNKD